MAALREQGMLRSLPRRGSRGARSIVIRKEFTMRSTSQGAVAHQSETLRMIETYRCFAPRAFAARERQGSGLAHVAPKPETISSISSITGAARGWCGTRFIQFGKWLGGPRGGRRYHIFR